MYDLILSRTIGASHVRRSIPCQDFGLVDEKDGCKIFVLSDGHGDINCIRSDRGSRFICETTADMLFTFVKRVTEDNKTELLFNLDKNLLKQLSSSIIGNWLSRIDDDIANDPITEESIKAIEAQAKKTIRYSSDYLNGIRCERAYGCTLIAGIMTEDYLFLLQHGDGRCILVEENGYMSQPIPWDDRCVGAMTTSCCDSDAVDSIRYAIIRLDKNKPLACFLASDGVEDSFTSIDAVYSFFCKRIIFAAENGVQALGVDLDSLLPELSAEGSADDITVCGIIDPAACIPYISKFESFSKRTELVDELRVTEDNIRSILYGGLYSQLKRERDRTTEQFDSLRKEYNELRAKLDRANKELQWLATSGSENGAELAIDNQKNDFTGAIESAKFTIEASIERLRSMLKRKPVESIQTGYLRQLTEKINLSLKRLDDIAPELVKAEKRANDAAEKFKKLDLEYQGYCARKEELESLVASLS